MKRGHTISDFKNIINTFRKHIPEITIWTDVIVGFPGETKEDFLKSKKLIKRIKPDFVNVSRYSTRENTDAKKMKQLPSEIKKKRSKIMSELVDKISLEQNKKWIGKACQVFVDEYNQKNNDYIGRNISYKPVILKKANLGETRKVKIKGAIKTGLKGQS